MYNKDIKSMIISMIKTNNYNINNNNNNNNSNNNNNNDYPSTAITTI